MKQLMRKALPVLLCICLLVVMLLPGFGIAVAEWKEQVNGERLDAFWEELCALDGEITNRLIVRSRHAIDTRNATQVASGYDNTYFLQFESAEDTEAALAYYRAQRHILSAEREQVYTLCDGEWDARGYESANHRIDDTLKLIQAYYGDRELPEVKVAVIDSGCEDDPAFYGDRVVSTGETDDEDYHGTYVTGTIFYNTLPNVKIYNYDCGSGRKIGNGNARTAIEKAYRDGCTVVNMSFGSYKKDGTMATTIADYYRKGMIFIAAAGNDNKDLSKEPHYPSCLSQVRCIGALTASRSKAGFSNYGSAVNFWTIGTVVRSYYRGEDITWQGTSAATPTMVSMVANLLTLKPELGSGVFSYFGTDSSYTNEDSAKRMPDNYAAAAAMIGQSLDTVNMTYDITVENGVRMLNLSAEEGSRIFYKSFAYGYSVQIPHVQDATLYDGNPIPITQNCTVTAVAYADGKARGQPLLINMAVDGGFTVTNGTLKYQGTQEAGLTVPSQIDGETVTAIGDAGFAGNPFVQTVVLPDSVTAIGAYAFACCPNLKKVVAPGVTNISRYAFVNCPQLLEVITPKMKTVYSCAFRYCTALRLVQSEPYKVRLPYTDSPAILTSDCAFQCFENGEAIYKSENSEIRIDAATLAELWDVYFLNRPVQDDAYYQRYLMDYTAVFDVTHDGVVNAKDYAAILRTAHHQE